MRFERYHKPAREFSAETRTFARMIVSLTEEAESINLVMNSGEILQTGDIVEHGRGRGKNVVATAALVAR